MQRENERVARKYKQQERDRIAKLVSQLHGESQEEFHTSFEAAHNND